MKYEMYQVNDAIKAHQRGYSTFQRRPKTWRSSGRQWDRIIRMVCSGCGKTLGRYEVYNRLAFCIDCRKFLFPETVGNFHEGGSKPQSSY